jgi:transcriptional/translational regulatory protein YebC/TACO1
MAKHSKRHNIRHKKAATDAKKSKIYSKIGKLIEIAARSGSDPTMNPSLDTVLQKAKYNSLPKEVIEKAIKKGSGQSS